MKKKPPKNSPAPTEATVALDPNAGFAPGAWIWIGMVAVVLAIVVAIVAFRFRRPVRKETPTWQLPASLTPFTVLGLLKRIQQGNGFDEIQGKELAQSIALVEGRYFALNSDGKPDLKNIAEDWLRRAPPTKS